MKPNNKKLFFVREMPASEEQDVSKLKRISVNQFEQLLSASQKYLLDEREKEALSGKVSKKSWAEIKQSVTSKRK